MNNLVKLENGEYGIANDVVKTIIEIEDKVKELKKMQDDYKEILLKEMEESNVLKVDTPEISITYVAPTQREDFDKKAFKEDCPEIYDSYVKFTDVKGSLRIKVK